jgi:polyhydroxybutyrate depolymerase
MKKGSLFVVILLSMLLLASCRLNRNAGKSEPKNETISPTTAATESAATAEPQAQILQFTPGRNDHTINVDNTPREFIVYVPSKYDHNSPTPVVVMIHGSNQSGNIMYENTGWAAKAEAENILVVFPTSWKYPLVGEGGVHEKWNTPGTASEVVPGTELKDDIKFIRSIVEALKATFNVDEKRIFASGFSNGGGFVLTRLIPSMNDVFAAYSTGGAGLIGEATLEDIPMQVSAPLYSVMGTNDNKISEGQGIPVPFPFTADELMNDPIFYGMLEKTATLLNLETSYTVESDPIFTRLTYADSTVGADNEYIFMMIRGIGHVYPSGDNNRAGINAADLFWDFFLKHPKP